MAEPARQIATGDRLWRGAALAVLGGGIGVALWHDPALLERREVTLGDEYGEKVAVLVGLKAGERVVTQGAYQLKLQELRPADAGAHSHET